MMTKRLVTFFHILLILPLVPLLQGCPNCNEDFVVEVLDVHWRVSDGAFSRESPYDRRTLQLSSFFELKESFAHSAPINPFLPTAFATSCKTHFSPNTSLASIQISESGTDITEAFVVDTHESVLYVEIDEYLQRERERISLVHTEVPDQDDLTWIVATTLENGQSFVDTLNFQLR